MYSDTAQATAGLQVEERQGKDGHTQWTGTKGKERRRKRKKKQAAYRKRALGEDRSSEAWEDAE